MEDKLQGLKELSRKLGGLFTSFKLPDFTLSLRKRLSLTPQMKQSSASDSIEPLTLREQTFRSKPMVNNLQLFINESVSNMKLLINKIVGFDYSRVGYYIRIWWIMSKNAFMVVLTHRSVFAIFFFGKLVRFTFYLGFLYFIVRGSNSIAGYGQNSVILFFLTFAVIDTVSQFFFREVYRFRPLILTGDFDLVLTKPMSSLFRVLLGGADVIDLATIPIFLSLLISVAVSFNPSLVHVVVYILLLINSLLIASAFHILVLSLGILTLEVDNTITVYRDLSSMGRFPIDIYRQPLRGFLTYVIPIGLMMTLPAKTLTGLASSRGVLTSFMFGIVLFYLSIRFWRFALKGYTSASS